MSDGADDDVVGAEDADGAADADAVGAVGGSCVFSSLMALSGMTKTS